MKHIKNMGCIYTTIINYVFLYHQVRFLGDYIYMYENPLDKKIIIKLYWNANVNHQYSLKYGQYPFILLYRHQTDKMGIIIEQFAFL
jgi:hypothetical protein